jgi:glutamine amidotransferase
VRADEVGPVKDGRTKAVDLGGDGRRPEPCTPSPLIGIVDHGMGNRRSVEKALERVGARVALTADHDALRAADGLVVPGVGAFAAAMRSMRALGLDELVVERAAEGTPVLGLCLGMQLLFESSTELGGDRGLGLLPGEVVALEAIGLKVPHIGWNEVAFTRDSPLLEGLGGATAFYHVHSFVAAPAEEGDVLGRGDYGGPFVSIVARGDVFGVQFHPEKSSAGGLRLLANFTAVCARVAA